MKSRFRRVLGGSLFLLNFLTAAWLMACFVASVVSAVEARHLALFSLTTPFAIAVNVAFVIFWLLSSHKARALLPAVALVAAYPVVVPVFGWNIFGKNDLAAGSGRLKVLSWNVHGLGIYDLPVDTTVPWRMLDYVKRESPDIACLVEFYTDHNNAFTPHGRTFLKEAGFKEYRFIWDNTLGTRIYVGIALYSKYKVRTVREVELASGIKTLQADVILPNGGPLRVLFIHLQSFMLADADKAYLRELKARRGDVGGKVQMSRTFVGRFARAFYLRSMQAEAVAKLVKDSPHPVLVCGDLIDVPGSYAYTAVRGKLKDAFVSKGHGLGRTYNQILPTLRIDDIFYDPARLQCLGFKTEYTPLSDHNPVMATFEILDTTTRR
jgi:endonuclease/exonuclease/phosphatase family metal-dependent hydrolase